MENLQDLMNNLKEEKVDRRKATGKRNIEKARQAKLAYAMARKKKAEEVKEYEIEDGSDSEEQEDIIGDNDIVDESEEDDEVYEVKPRRGKTASGKKPVAIKAVKNKKAEKKANMKLQKLEMMMATLLKEAKRKPKTKQVIQVMNPNPVVEKKSEPTPKVETEADKIKKKLEGLF